jgi:hypothetical protein
MFFRGLASALALPRHNNRGEDPQLSSKCFAPALRSALPTRWGRVKFRLQEGASFRLSPKLSITGVVCLKKQVGVAEKRFCEAKTFGARGSSVKKSLLQGKIGLPFTSTVLPLLNLLTVGVIHPL